MIRDPLYRKIVKRLSGTIDPELFEQCAVDLLRQVYPGLVPVQGGSDSGLDGAIADLHGEAFPLVTTTSSNAIGNLTKNLKKYAEDGGPRRKVIFATPRYLTPQKRENLKERAKELGFVLVQIHDQRDFADRLYRDPNWRRELLSITGDPAPLSIVPKSERPFLNLPLVGRDADLTWLRETKADKLLIGQPGSGKTYLARKFAAENGGLFVNSDDRGEIADGIRSQRPRTLIVDDAQVHHDLLLQLKQLREELGARFTILATGWLGDETTLGEALNLPAAQVHTLDLLPRPDILEIIKAAGIQGPNPLLRELVDQAEGRPGLAVTLADLCLKGDVRQVALGDALSRSLLKYFQSTLGERATCVLAAFSIGGNWGMALPVVAGALQLGLPDLLDIVVKLTAGGVVQEAAPRRLAVRPPALREVLVCDIFFSDAALLSSDHLLMNAPSPVDAALTLVGASARGAVIPQDLFAGILEKADSDLVWEAYAYQGRDEANWVLMAHPEKLGAIARPALENLPEFTVPLLMQAAIGDERELNSTPEHPLRLINDWIRAGQPGTGQPIRRRQIALDAALAWLKDGKDRRVGMDAVVAAFSPGFEMHEIDPGAGNSITFHRGIPAPEELRAITEFWPKARELLQIVAIDDWAPFRRLTETWAYPEQTGLTLPNEMSGLMRDFARQLLLDIVAMSSPRPDIGYWAFELAKELHIEIPVRLDSDFQALYPPAEHENWEEAEEAQKAAVAKLASDWGQHDPEEIAARIASIENTARKAKLFYPRWTPFLCEQIAAQVDSPIHWARILAPTLKNGDLVLLFLKKSALRNDPEWVATADGFLNQKEVMSAAVTVVLTVPNPPSALLNKCLGSLTGYYQGIEFLSVRGEIPETTLRSLLRHADARIASAVAMGEWHRRKGAVLPSSLQDDWRDAIMRSTDDEFWLREVLIRNPELAHQWIMRRLGENMLGEYKLRRIVVAAISVLDLNAKKYLLRSVPATYDMEDVIASLVDDNLDLYRDLLGIERLKSFHLVPLAGSLGGIWIEKAKLALDAGYSAQEVAMAAYPSFLSWRGPESEMRVGWVQRFDVLCSNEDGRIRQVGELGKANAEERLRRALEEERREAIYGRN